MQSPQDLPHPGPLRLPESSPLKGLLRRIALALALVAVAVIVLWLTRDGLRDNVNPGDPLSLGDVIYFAVVSLTTLGYGDIAPATLEARWINTLLVTPIRIFLWILFLGTTYELTVLRLRLREERQMRDLHERLHDHVIICGYGVKGQAIIEELIAHGQDRRQIVVIDPDETAIAHASKAGIVALKGDASSEAMLEAAAIAQASYVLAVPKRDDACVLICLTVRALAPDIHLVVAAREEENIKLLYGAGANLVVAPSVSGGRLMASAVRQQAVPRFLEDVLTYGEGLTVSEYVVPPEEDGRYARELPELKNDLVLGMMRGRHRYPFQQLDRQRLQAGDVVVYLAREPEVERREAREDATGE